MKNLPTQENTHESTRLPCEFAKRGNTTLAKHVPRRRFGGSPFPNVLYHQRSQRKVFGRCGYVDRSPCGGEDQNRHTSESGKESKHLIKFDIPFNSHRPQPFEGYVFTWGKRTMAGYTWWEGIPFGWYAEKR